MKMIDPHWIKVWLWTGVILVSTMVTIGGITRLTGSGLSIVRWDVVSGTLPPLNAEQWQEEFNAYQQSPQFKLVNSHFSIDDFKEIFWWEYIHRLLGRIIGIVFIIPFVVIVPGSRVSAPVMKHLWIILALGAAQGLMGWLMVKSGLVDMPHVSHFRLTLHLCLALLLIFFILRTLFVLEAKSCTGNQGTALIQVALLVLVIQIIAGGLVAGLKAGYSYTDYPLMGGELIPSAGLRGPNLLSNGVAMQFFHRWFAWALPVVIVVISLQKRQYNERARRLLLWVIATTVIQILLGIITLTLRVPIAPAVLHQAVAIALFILLVQMWFAASSPGVQV